MLFPGQGAQEAGMGADLFSSLPEFSAWLEIASDAVGANLRQVCLRGPDRELARTEFLQPLLVAVCLGYWRKLNQAGVVPDVVLGHSLGEVAALAAAGVVSPETAVRMAAKRGALMAQCAAKADGGMCAVVTREREKALESLEGLLAGREIVVANDNSPGQFVLSGKTGVLAGAADILSAHRLGTCRKLAVSGPWHSPFMVDASREFASWLAGIPLHAPLRGLIMNVSGEAEDEPGRIRTLLARNLVEPVLWRSSMKQVLQLAPEVIFEVGPGRVLSGLARANGIGDRVKIVNVNNARGLALAGELTPRSSAR
jgi:[acyl-carrier-protein] S-malonyltransferase